MDKDLKSYKRTVPKCTAFSLFYKGVRTNLNGCIFSWQFIDWSIQNFFLIIWLVIWLETMKGMPTIKNIKNNEILNYYYFLNYLLDQNSLKPALKTGWDRAKRHDFWSQFLLFILLLSFPLFLREKRKGERITKVVFKSHAFLLDPGWSVQINLLKLCVRIVKIQRSNKLY